MASNCNPTVGIHTCNAIILGKFGLQKSTLLIITKNHVLISEWHSLKLLQLMAGCKKKFSQKHLYQNLIMDFKMRRLQYSIKKAWNSRLANLKLRASESPGRCLFLLTLRKFCQIVVTILLVFCIKTYISQWKLCLLLTQRLELPLEIHPKNIRGKIIGRALAHPVP